MVCIVPELCCYKQLIARDAAGSNGLSDGLFGPVSIFVSGYVATKPWVHSRLSSVNMAVSCLDCFCDSIFLGLCVLPGAESNGRDLSASVELELGRHGREFSSSGYIHLGLIVRVRVVWSFLGRRYMPVSGNWNVKLTFHNKVVLTFS